MNRTRADRPANYEAELGQMILANPPFNVSDWGGDRLREDQRWQYGVPPVRNAQPFPIHCYGCIYRNAQPHPRNHHCRGTSCGCPFF